MPDWPPKLPPNCPLSLHPKGYQARIAGKTRWIAGKVPLDQALAAYHRKAAALVTKVQPMAEPKPPKPNERVTLEHILNRWLIDCRNDVVSGDLRVGTYGQYRRSARRVNKLVGHWLVEDVNPEMVRDLYSKLAAAHTPDAAKRAIVHLRTCCQHAAEQGWCGLVRVGTKTIRRLARRAGATMRWKLYTPAQVRTILAELDKQIGESDGRRVPTLTQLRAMILLALNGGFGAMEVSELKKSEVDLAGGWLRHARGKTGAPHLVPLWPETRAALEPVLAQRPGDDLLFRTREGNPWCRVEAAMKGGKVHKPVANDNVAYQFTQLVGPLGLKVRGQNFYKLKHLASTTADGAKDPHATFALFGHKLPGAKSHYVEVSPERIAAVAEHVRRVLLLDPLSPPEGSP